MARASMKVENIAAATAVGALRPGTAVITVEEGIGLANLQKIIARLVELHGCRACGLGGLDLRIRIQDKLLAEQFAGIEGLRDIGFVR